MPTSPENVQPISPELAAQMIPLCRVPGCQQLEGHTTAHGPIRFAMTPIERPIRKWTRNYQYGRSRANDWPLWISWLLAPSKDARQRVRELMEIRRGN